MTIKWFLSVDLSNVLREKDIKSKQELYAYAENQREAGNMDLYSFILVDLEEPLFSLYFYFYFFFFCHADWISETTGPFGLKLGTYTN